MGYYDDVRDGLIPPDSPIHEQFKQLQGVVQGVVDDINGIIQGEYTSYWEDGAAVTTAAMYNPDTKIVFDIQMSGTYIDSSLYSEEFTWFDKTTGKRETLLVHRCDDCDEITSHNPSTGDWYCIPCFTNLNNNAV